MSSAGAAGYGDTDALQLDPVIITATRNEKSLSEIPYAASVVDLESDKAKAIFRTVPEALKYEPGIMIQKTGHGQGSPYIRGFTGFRTLFLVDGIRLNNSVWRDGPNNYVGTVDPYSISRMEVVRGPSSALYGSDAIGGTVNMISQGNTSTETGFNLHPNVYYRFADAENSHTGHAETTGNYDDKLGFLLGLTYKDYGDVVAGDPVGLQPKTGYRDVDVNFKGDYALTPDAKLTFVHQHVQIDDAWRSHSTQYAVPWNGTVAGTDQKRSLDQKRELTYVKYQGKNFNGLFDNLNVTTSFQQQDESETRILKAGTANNRNPIQQQGFQVDTVGLTIQADKTSDFGKWTYGIEYYHDSVNSFRNNYNTDGSFRNSEIQGPVADGSSYDLFDIFMQNEYALLDSLDLTVGGRYTHAAVDAQKIKDPVSGLQTTYSSAWNNLAGNARLMYHIDEEHHWNVFSGVSQGFRAPNLSDLTRLDTALSGERETSTLDLKPEQYISYEAGIKTDFEDWSAQLTYFYTDITDMIIRVPTGNVIDGQREVTKKNSGSGFVQGIEFGGTYRFDPQWTAFSSASWTEGMLAGYPTSAPQLVDEPMSKMIPVMANFGLRWDSLAKNWWVEGMITLASNQDKLSSSDLRDTQRIPPGGTPGYAVYNIRGGWRVNKHVNLTLALENLSDADYRVHGSGLNEPGRNFIMGVGVKF
ncbi:MAG: TonB-dependent receptor [Methylomonas sp.]|jgi:hemoglobin/transferrin/lactoferrin receptor protein|uniref:TonB-dependent receptor plug domain-containing protein n=1 Tax=Methylomonas sp. TaxID=418 RepID=UPI0025CC3B9A|nr:TonB-dependent receptor [Methylomonas sp.]MCK9607048.1 TonB-dependent receptor [Methylomonas sp.]